MPDKTALNGSPTPVEIAAGGYTLQAPGMLGEVEEVAAADHATRSGTGYHEEALLESLRNAEMHIGKIFEIAIEADQRPVIGDGATRADGLTATTREGEPAVVFRMPPLGDMVDYAVLYSDEAGVTRWLFPVTGQKDDADVMFHLPRNSPKPVVEPEGPATGEETRGPISKLGRRLVRIVAWATDPIIGKTAKAVARAWESTNRPYDFHAVQPGLIGGDVSWDSMRQGRSLLLLHGTLSTGEAAFSGLVRSPKFEALAACYEQRIFAFNHPSLHHTPAENTEWLLSNLPPGLDLDVVTHSRGGLVARSVMQAVTERQAGVEGIRIGKCIMVAAPNRGTVLARGETWFDLIDRYTNLLTSLPDNVYTLVLEGVLALVKLVARGSVKGLPGLNSMLPDGPFLAELNQQPAPSAQLYAIAADFVPGDPGLLKRFGKTVADTFVDRVFGEANDGVVPTEGMIATGLNAAGFPIPNERCHLIALDVHHLNYFKNEDVNGQIYDWLNTKY